MQIQAARFTIIIHATIAIRPLAAVQLLLNVRTPSPHVQGVHGQRIKQIKQI